MPLPRLVITLVPALAVAAANWVVAGMLGPTERCVACVAWLIAGPVLLALLVLTLLSRATPPPAVIVRAPLGPPSEPSEIPALRLLGVLQDEGRFVDFLQEDLSPYPDEQIGAAARGIHDGCRKVLQEHVTIEPVVRAHEGETVTLESGFDPASIRLTGNVGTNPPFRGVVRHTGWRVARATLPARGSEDPHILAP